MLLINKKNLFILNIFMNFYEIAFIIDLDNLSLRNSMT